MDNCKYSYYKQKIWVPDGKFGDWEVLRNICNTNKNLNTFFTIKVGEIYKLTSKFRFFNFNDSNQYETICFVYAEKSKFKESCTHNKDVYFIKMLNLENGIVYQYSFIETDKLIIEHLKNDFKLISYDN